MAVFLYRKAVFVRRDDTRMDLLIVEGVAKYYAKFRVVTQT